jgi:Wzt C-terminal domain/Sulfotransferase family
VHRSERRLRMLPTHYIFNHIPKTGGNTLLTICRHNLMPADFSPHLTEHEIRLMPAARFERFPLVVGHFSVLTQAGFCRSRYSMTLLRDPILRIVSAYTYWRSAEESNPVTSKAKELPFAAFVHYFKDSPAIVQNPYTHQFAGIGRDFPRYPAEASALLAAAKKNLAAFDFIGICEEFERSARLLCGELGWQLPTPMPHENRSSSEDTLRGVDAETMEMLRGYNRLDLELYDYGLNLFHAREAAMQSGAGCMRTAEANRFVPFPIPYAPERRAVIRDVSARWVAGEDSRMLELTVSFRAHVGIADLDLGVQVNDAAGKVVWGTSISRENLELNYEPGCDCHVSFFIQCELPCGIYFVTAALSEPRRLGFHEHWIDHAAAFEVTPPRVAVSPYVRGMMRQGFRSTIDQRGQRGNELSGVPAMMADTGSLQRTDHGFPG